jgi:hypothetical protein
MSQGLHKRLCLPTSVSVVMDTALLYDVISFLENQSNTTIHISLTQSVQVYKIVWKCGNLDTTKIQTHTINKPSTINSKTGLQTINTCTCTMSKH